MSLRSSSWAARKTRRHTTRTYAVGSFYHGIPVQRIIFALPWRHWIRRLRSMRTSHRHMRCALRCLPTFLSLLPNRPSSRKCVSKLEKRQNEPWRSRQDSVKHTRLLHMFAGLHCLISRVLYLNSTVLSRSRRATQISCGVSRASTLNSAAFSPQLSLPDTQSHSIRRMSKHISNWGRFSLARGATTRR